MEKKSPAAMPSDLRSHNMSAILNTVCRKKHFAVTDIAQSTHLSRQTVSKALAELLNLRFIVPAGKGSSTSTGGKKPLEYELNDSVYVISMSTCRHKILFSLMTLSYRRVDEIAIGFFLESDSAYPVEKFISEGAAACLSLMERNHIDRKDILGVSINYGGIIDEAKGIIRYCCSMPHWGRNIEMGRMFREALGNRFQVAVDDVSRVCARTMISEKNLNQRNIVVIYCDLGIGVTRVEEGVIVPSAHNVANEWGHMVLDPWDSERCGCGAYGCFEVLIGERRIMSKINALPPERRLILLQGFDPEKDIRVHVMKKSEQGNPDALVIEQYMVDLFGSAVRSIYLSVDPDYIVIQGSFADCTESFIEKVKRKVKENLYLTDVEIDIRRYPKDLQELQEIGSVNTMMRCIAGEALSLEG